MNIRRIEANDLAKVLACNLHNLPENYPMRFWAYIILNWPELSFLAEDECGKVVGYVLSSIEPAEGDPHTLVGHINSLSVLRPYRRLGLAQKLMCLTKDAMLREDATIQYLQLHVRKSNKAALSLYDKLGYRCCYTEEKYYADGEDALVMRFLVQSGDPQQQPHDRPSVNTRRWTLKAWIAHLWRSIHDKPYRFLGATMTLLQKRNPSP